MAKNYYQILSVTKTATPQQIKAAYRKLARKYHPDVNPGDKSAEQRFKEISEAYSVLSEPKKRKQYDHFGTTDPGAFAGSGHGGGFNFTGFDFGAAGSSFGNIFDEIFKSSRKKRKPQRPRRGVDQQHVVNLDFMDALRGISTELAITRRLQCATCRGQGHIITGGTRKCKTCGGSGRTKVQSGGLVFEKDCPACGGTGSATGEPCKTCRGAGTVPKAEKITVRIPPGVENGSRVRVAGKGDEGFAAGPPGDLYILTRVSPHKYFTRKGNNIYVNVPITVTEAALGMKLEVPTVNGSATIRIPPSTQSGQRFRLRGKGAKALRGGGNGDQYVEVTIVLPQVIDEGAKEIYRELQKHEHWNPRKDKFDNV